MYMLGVTFSSDLSLEKHVCKTCAASIHWLHQLHRIRKSLDDRSATTLVHAFVTCGVDYCNAVYGGTPKTVPGKLQQVLNAAARVISDTRKFDHGLTSLLHDELHWLDVPERVTYMYKMGVMMYRCLHDQASRIDTLLTISPRPPTSLLGFVCVLQTVTSSLYLAVVSTHMAIFDRRSDGLELAT